MHGLFLDILNKTIFGSGEDSMALVSKPLITAWEPLLPETCQLHSLSRASSYINDLVAHLKGNDIAILLIVPPLISCAALPAKWQKAYPNLGLHEIALQVAVDNAPEGRTIAAWMPHGFFINKESEDLRNQINTEATPQFIIDFNDMPDALTSDDSPLMHLLVIKKDTSEDKLALFFRCPRVPMLVTSDGTLEVNAKREKAVLGDLRLS